MIGNIFKGEIIRGGYQGSRGGGDQGYTNWITFSEEKLFFSLIETSNYNFLFTHIYPYIITKGINNYPVWVGIMYPN